MAKKTHVKSWKMQVFSLIGEQLNTSEVVNSAGNN